MDSNRVKILGTLIVVLLVVGGVLAGVYLLQPQQPDETDSPFVTIIGADGTSTNVTLTNMLSMNSVTGNSSYQNSYNNVRGTGTYTGVKISDLVDLVGGMIENDSLKITASDEYTVTFEYGKIYPDETTLAIQGEMVLAYEYNGTVVPDYEDGFRIAFLPGDGYYSNADANDTTDPNPSSAGTQWISNVVKLEVIEAQQPEETALTLYYEDNVVPLTLSEIEALSSISGEGGYKTSGGSIRGPYNITGVRFTTLLGQISDLPSNYTVTTVAGDDWTTEYTKAMVDGQLSGYTPSGDPIDTIQSIMVLAYQINGSPILDDDGPLRITFLNEDGNLTDGFLWAKNVINITVVEVEPISFILKYEDTTLEFTLSEIKALTSISGEGGYRTSTGSIRGPYQITGVAMSTLLSLLPSLPDNYTLTAISGDDWITEYTKAMVDGQLSGYTPTGDPLDSINSTMVLAYEIDGSPIPEGSGPLRITFLNEDGNLTDGSLWAKWVINITVIEVPLSPPTIRNSLTTSLNPFNLVSIIEKVKPYN